MRKIKIAEIQNLLDLVLIRNGLTQKDAKIVSEDFVAGELSGHKSHGLMAFPSLILKKRIKKNAKIKIEKDGSVYSLINGGGSLGQVAAVNARELVVKKAKKYGIAIVGCYNTTAFLRPGYQAQKIAEKKLIGIVAINGGKAAITPIGSIKAIFGTNPIGFAIPTKDYPIVADFATAKKAWGEMRLAKFFGHKLPPETFLDKKGKFTLSPELVESIIPFGGHKGYALALLVEILTGSLVKMPMGNKSGNLRGSLFVAIDPSKFTAYNNFIAKNTKLIKQIKNLKKEKGVKEIIIPGDRSYKNRKTIEQRGYFEIDEKVYRTIKSLL